MNYSILKIALVWGYVLGWIVLGVLDKAGKMNRSGAVISQLPDAGEEIAE